MVSQSWQWAIVGLKESRATLRFSLFHKKSWLSPHAVMSVAEFVASAIQVFGTSTRVLHLLRRFCDTVIQRPCTTAAIVDPSHGVPQCPRILRPPRRRDQKAFIRMLEGLPETAGHAG